MFTWLSSPNSITMRKKIHDQIGAPGNFVTAFGYAMNASPGPVKSKITKKLNSEDNLKNPKSNGKIICSNTSN